MILATVEVRWFYAGSIPGAIQSWFQREGVPVLVQAPRTDFYLLSQSAALGIKLRENGLEVKERQAVLPQLELPGAIGTVESWNKTRFELADAPDLVHNQIALKSWLPVTKKRLLRFFAVVGEKVTAVPPEAARDDRCEVELSEIVACEQKWWSLALEAAGTAAGQHAYLQETARHFCATPPPRPLDLAHSLSYPAWLLENFKN